MVKASGFLSKSSQIKSGAAVNNNRSAISNGRQVKSCSGWVFNFKLDSFASYQHDCFEFIVPRLAKNLFRGEFSMAISYLFSLDNCLCKSHFSEDKFFEFNCYKMLEYLGHGLSDWKMYICHSTEEDWVIFIFNFFNFKGWRKKLAKPT